jgi:hypothetical protein
MQKAVVMVCGIKANKLACGISSGVCKQSGPWAKKGVVGWSSPPKKEEYGKNRGKKKQRLPW